MIGISATWFDTSGLRPRRNQGRAVCALQESGDCGVPATLSGFLNEAPLQRRPRHLSFGESLGEAGMLRSALLSVMALLLLGASARAQIYIYHANDTGGIIPWSCENEAM